MSVVQTKLPLSFSLIITILKGFSHLFGNSDPKLLTRLYPLNSDISISFSSRHYQLKYIVSYLFCIISKLRFTCYLNQIAFKVSQVCLPVFINSPLKFNVWFKVIFYTITFRFKIETFYRHHTRASQSVTNLFHFLLTETVTFYHALF